MLPYPTVPPEGGRSHEGGNYYGSCRGICGTCRCVGGDHQRQSRRPSSVLAELRKRAQTWNSSSPAAQNPARE